MTKNVEKSVGLIWLTIFNKLLPSFLSIALLGGFLFWVVSLVISAKTDVTLMATSASAIVKQTSANDDSVTGVFSLSLNGQHFLTGTTIRDFASALFQLETENGGKIVTFRAIDAGEKKVISTQKHTLSEFGYTLNTQKIVEKIKAAMINRQDKLDISLAEYLYFDDSSLNVALDAFEKDKTSKSEAKLVFDRKSFAFQADSSEEYVSTLIKRVTDFEKLSSTPRPRDANIDLVFNVSKNPIFDRIDALNKKAKELSEIEISISEKSEGNAANVRKFIEWINTESQGSIRASSNGGDFQIRFPKGFALKFLAYDGDKDKIVFDSKAFLAKYAFLEGGKVYPSDLDFKPKASLFEVSDGNATDNAPKSSDFEIIQSDNGLKFDVAALTYAFSTYIASVVQSDAKTLGLKSLSLSLGDEVFRSIPNTEGARKLDILSAKEVVYDSGISLIPGIYFPKNAIGFTTLTKSEKVSLVPNGFSAVSIDEDGYMLSSNIGRIGKVGINNGKIYVTDISDKNISTIGGEGFFKSGSTMVFSGEKLKSLWDGNERSTFDLKIEKIATGESGEKLNKSLSGIGGVFTTEEKEGSVPIKYSGSIGNFVVVKGNQGGSLRYVYVISLKN